MKPQAPGFVAPTLVKCVEDLLSSRDPDRKTGTTVVLGSSRLSRRLASAGFSVVSVVKNRDRAARLSLWAAKERPEGQLRAVVGAPNRLPFAPASVRSVVAVRVLEGLGKGRNVGETVRALGRAVEPEGLLAVGEMAAEGWAGRLFLRITRRALGRPESLDPADLCAFMLDAGVRRVEQVWPQGVGGYVFTYGSVGPLARYTGQARSSR